MSTKLPPNPFMHEILAEVSKARSRDKKVELLKEHRNDALTAILIWNFDDTVISMVPEGEVPYGDIGDQTVYSGTLSDNLEITAETDDGLIMGVQHKQYNIHGVQFHPESIKTKLGMKILKNFINY